MYIIETEQGGLSTQLGEPVASVELAIAVCTERAQIARSVVGQSPPFRLTLDGNPLNETDTAEWLAGAVANSFETF